MKKKKKQRHTNSNALNRRIQDSLGEVRAENWKIANVKKKKKQMREYKSAHVILTCR